MTERHLHVVPEAGEVQESFPELSVITILENMPYEERMALRTELLEKLSDAESMVHAINRINEIEKK